MVDGWSESCSAACTTVRYGTESGGRDFLLICERMVAQFPSGSKRDAASNPCRAGAHPCPASARRGRGQHARLSAGLRSAAVDGSLAGAPLSSVPAVRAPGFVQAVDHAVATWL